MRHKRTIKEMMRIIKEEWPHYKRELGNKLTNNLVKKVDKKVVNKLYNKAKQLKW